MKTTKLKSYFCVAYLKKFQTILSVCQVFIKTFIKKTIAKIN